VRARRSPVRLGLALALPLLLPLFIAGAPRLAHAIEPDGTWDNAVQAYDVRSPSGQTVLERTRFTSTLGASLYDITGNQSTQRNGPELDFRARVRYDADYGISGAETNPGVTTNFVPGLNDNTGLVDVMYAYLEGRRYLHGVLGFKLGRQYMVDSLGWWSFDGAEVKATLAPVYTAVEAYGGLEVRGGMPLSTSRFEAGGVWRGNRSSFDPSLYPQFQPADVAPAFGAAIETAGFSWLHGRLTYRRVYDTGAVGLTEFPNANIPAANYNDLRVSTDKIGYSVEADYRTLGAIKGGFSYDLYDVKFNQIYASIEVFPVKRLTISVDYDYFAPTYDADSIWNVFASEPINDVSLRGSWVQDRFSVSAGGHARIYTVDTSQPNPSDASPNLVASPGAAPLGYYPTNGHPFDEGGDLEAKYKWSAGRVGLRGAVDVGDAGDRVGADVSAEHVFEQRYITRARVGVWSWDDKLRPDRDATNVGYMLGVGYRFAPRCQSVFEFQDDINRLVGSRYRALLTLSLAFGR
jgi:hypothetical protein